MRDYHCTKYPECLDEAAKLDLNFNCNRCAKEGKSSTVGDRKRKVANRYPPRVNIWRKAAAAEIVMMINERKGAPGQIIAMINERFEL